MDAVEVGALALDVGKFGVDKLKHEADNRRKEYSQNNIFDKFMQTKCCDIAVAFLALAITPFIEAVTTFGDQHGIEDDLRIEPLGEVDQAAQKLFDDVEHPSIAFLFDRKIDNRKGKDKQGPLQRLTIGEREMKTFLVDLNKRSVKKMVEFV